MSFLETMLKPSQVASLMGVDVRTVQRRAKSGSLTCEIQSNAKNRPEYIFPLSTLPKHVQERYYARHSLTLSTPEKTALQKVKPSPVQRPLDSYTDAERKEIGFWRDVVDQWMFYRSQPGKPLSELDAKFVRHMRVENPGQELSVATLYRKKKALEEGDLNSVIDRRGKARKGKTDMPEYIKRRFCTTTSWTAERAMRIPSPSAWNTRKNGRRKRGERASATLVQQLLPHGDGCAGGCAHPDARG